MCALTTTSQSPSFLDQPSTPAPSHTASSITLRSTLYRLSLHSFPSARGPTGSPKEPDQVQASLESGPVGQGLRLHRPVLLRRHTSRRAESVCSEGCVTVEACVGTTFSSSDRSTRWSNRRLTSAGGTTCSSSLPNVLVFR